MVSNLIGAGGPTSSSAWAQQKLIGVLVRAMSSSNETLAFHGASALYSLVCLEDTRQLVVAAGCEAVAGQVANQNTLAAHMAGQISEVISAR